MHLYSYSRRLKLEIFPGEHARRIPSFLTLTRWDPPPPPTPHEKGETRDFHARSLYYPWGKIGTTVYFTTLIFLSGFSIIFSQTLHKPAQFHLGDWGSFFFRFLYHCGKYKRNWPWVQASLSQCTKYHNFFRLNLFLLCITNLLKWLQR